MHLPPDLRVSRSDFKTSSDPDMWRGGCRSGLPSQLMTCKLCIEPSLAGIFFSWLLLKSSRLSCSNWRTDSGISSNLLLEISSTVKFRATVLTWSSWSNLLRLRRSSYSDSRDVSASSDSVCNRLLWRSMRFSCSFPPEMIAWINGYHTWAKLRSTYLL